MSFYDDLATLHCTNEAEVETRLVLPLLGELGYATHDIHPKYPVIFQEGRKGRRHEADFAIFSSAVHTKETSLLVIEAKRPDEGLGDGKAQGESYASNLRAPFLLLTNGLDLEVWQIQVAGESKLVFSAPVSSLPSRRGELELLLAKPAALHYAESLRRAPAHDVVQDYGTYFDAEYARTEQVASAIVRNLYPVAADAAATLQSDLLLERIGQGAVVLGPSGYGKTTLAAALLRQIIEQGRQAPPGYLPFELGLPDIVSSGQSLVEYAHQRLASHCPQITRDAFRYILRTEGATFILDGYDRVGFKDREAITVQIKGVLRDYPAAQIVVCPPSAPMAQI